MRIDDDLKKTFELKLAHITNAFLSLYNEQREWINSHSRQEYEQRFPDKLREISNPARYPGALAESLTGALNQRFIFGGVGLEFQKKSLVDVVAKSLNSKINLKEVDKRKLLRSASLNAGDYENRMRRSKDGHFTSRVLDASTFSSYVALSLFRK